MIRFILMATLLPAFSTAWAGQPEPNVYANLPAVSRAWNGSDYQVTADAIASGIVPLPTNTNKSGEALLRRLCATENLSFQNNKSLPIVPRLQDSLQMQAAMTYLGKRYFKAAESGESVHTELAAVLAFMLRVAGSGAERLDEYLPTVPRDNDYESRLRGLGMIKSGLTNMLLGAEVTLSERTFYTEDDLSVVIVAMADVLPSVAGLLEADFRAELSRKLAFRRKSTTREIDAVQFDRMLSVLEAQQSLPSEPPAAR